MVEEPLSRPLEMINRLMQDAHVARFVYMVVIVGTGFYLVQLATEGEFEYGTALGILFGWFLLIILLEPPGAARIDDDAFDTQYLDQLVS